MRKAEVEEPPLQYVTGFNLIHDLIGETDFFRVTAKYPFVTTPYYFSLAKHSLNDPIMKQLCPSLDELNETAGEEDDPLAEEASSPVPGLVHRYPDRVLMIVTNQCFMNCRHCTRKRLWAGGRHACSITEIKRMIDYISENPSIRDVIVSGGDPLTFSDDILDVILSMIRNIPHVEIIRVGSRAPVVNPNRITYDLLVVLSKYRPLWFNTQFNHVNEITPYSSRAIEMILETGIPVNNQSVLLKGINDQSEDIPELCRALLKIGVRPYYLFHCDPVTGVSHFRTALSKGIEIIERMRGHTSGLAVPVYVVDAVRGGGKIPLQPDYVLSSSSDHILLRNYMQQHFLYENTA